MCVCLCVCVCVMCVCVCVMCVCVCVCVMCVCVCVCACMCVHVCRTHHVTVSESSESKKASTSSWHLAWCSGWVARLYRAQEIPLAVVSWPSNMNVSTSARISSSVIPTPFSSYSESTLSHILTLIEPDRFTKNM